VNSGAGSRRQACHTQCTCEKGGRWWTSQIDRLDGGGVPVTIADLCEIEAAATRLENIIVHTPLVPLHSYAEQNGILLKPEVLQPISSFKLRGVYNWAACLTAEERERGLSTFGSGNTAQALGYVGRLFGVSARSILPDFTPDVKIDAIGRYGAEAVVLPEAEALSWLFEAGWEQEPYSFLNPWTDPMMIAGNATMGLEILSDLPDLDTVYVPVGGGGLMSGIGSALRALKPSAKIIGVQSEACPPLRASFEAGRPTWVEAKPTICEGAALPLVIDRMYPILRDIVYGVAVVSEEEVKAAIRRLALGNKLIVEGAGALSVAAALATPAEERGRSVCILSGGSIDSSRLLDMLQ
jgi:threonine dehydratase